MNIYEKAITEIRACIHHGLDQAEGLEVWHDGEHVLTFDFTLLGGGEEEIEGVIIEHATGYAEDKQFDVTLDLQTEVNKHFIYTLKN